MKAVKRNFLTVEEHIRLNEINNFQAVRYFNPNHFSLEEKLNLHFDYSEGLGAEQLLVKAIYIDTSQKMELYKAIEFSEELKLSFPLGGITKKKELSVALKLKEDAKVLWKIAIQIQQEINTLIHLTLS